MKNMQLKYILQALMHEHEKIMSELNNLMDQEGLIHQAKINHLKDDIQELIDTEYAALGVYINNAAKKVRNEFNRLEMGLKKLSDSIDVSNAKTLGGTIRENLRSEEELIFHALEKEYELTG